MVQAVRVCPPNPEDMAKKLLVDRWKEGEPARLLAAVVAELAKNRQGAISLPKSPFGMTAELHDWRGASFESASIYGLSAEEVNFESANFENAWIEKSNFIACNFQGATFRSLADHGNSFQKCIFLRSNFSGARLGYRASKYEQCLFEASAFTRSGFIAPIFVLCEFKGVSFKSIDFYASSFEECSFSGRLEDVWFRNGYPIAAESKRFGEARPNLMKNVSFYDAELLAPNFTGGCDLSTVILPKSGNCVLFDRWGERMKRLALDIQKWPLNERKEGDIFLRCYLEPSDEQHWMILDRKELNRGFAPIANKLLLVLSAD